MHVFRWFSQCPLLAVLIVAPGLAAGDAVSRIRRVELVSGLRGGMVDQPALDRAQ